MSQQVIVNFFFFSIILLALKKSLQTPIWLKFGTHIGGLKANASIKSWINLNINQGAINDFTHKAKPNFCSGNRFEEQAENWCVARLNIIK